MLNEILLLLLLLFLMFYKNKGILPKNIPPGPWRIPGIGNLIQMGLCKRKMPYETFHEISRRYGPITFLQVGVTYQVLLEDFDIIKEVLTDEVWIDRYYSKWMANRSFGKILGVLMVSGNCWKEMRRFSVRTLRDFGFGKQKSMEMELNEELVDFTSRLEREIEQNRVVNMKQLFTVSVLNVLWSMIAGCRFSHHNAQLHDLLSIIDEEVRTNPIGSLTSPIYLYSAFPFLATFAPLYSTMEAQCVKARTRLHEFFRNILDNRRAEGTYKEDQRDYIDVFLREIDAHKNDDPDQNLYTDEQFIVVTMDLFMAGSETTSNTLEFGIFYLIKHPEVQRKIQMEIDSVVGNNRFPAISDKVNMPYTEATILEIQRHANVVPIDIRAVTRETTLRGYRIPAETAAVINLYAMHMSEKLWEEPLRFRPERFLNPDGEVVNADKILPFGAGKRGCLGEQLAKASVFTYLTTMLQKFTFEEASSHPLPDNEPIIGFTLSPKHYHALIKPRFHRT